MSNPGSNSPNRSNPQNPQPPGQGQPGPGIPPRPVGPPSGQPPHPSAGQPPVGYPQGNQPYPPAGYPPAGQTPGGQAYPPVGNAYQAQPYGGQQPYPGGPGYQAGQPYQTPGGIPTGYAQPQGDSTGGVIPYKNPKALIAYYTGIGAMVPVLGIVLAPVAIVLGIMGLIARQKNPAIKGSVHAWIGIVGGLGGLLLNACILFAIFAAVSGEMQDNRGQYEMPADTY